VIPRENAEAVWKAKDVEFDVARIDEIEAVTKHDVIAFLTHLAEMSARRGALRPSGHDLLGRARHHASTCSWCAPPTS
jgi:adenylosuccinate lyase